MTRLFYEVMPFLEFDVEVTLRINKIFTLIEYLK